MNLKTELIYQLNKLRGHSHFASNVRLRSRKLPDAVGERISYHEFADLGIPGLFNVEPLLPRYHFPELRGRKVLDVGCATGFFSRYFSQQGAHVTSVDVDTTAVKKINHTQRIGLQIVEANCFDLDYCNHFDVVFCGSLLLHVFNPVGLAEIFHRALHPGGTFVLATGALPSRRPEIRLYARQTVRTETSTDDALWWISEKAQINMLLNAGFSRASTVDSFILASTRYACAQGYCCALRHNVYQATK
jgi:2-polyprenyl-3-methyl-5-hydroxy-6-metoxy-1,4-benzoquinol methylase